MASSAASLLPLLLLLLNCSLCWHVSASPAPSVANLQRFLENLHGELAPAAVQESAATGVLHRLIPSHAESFEFRIVSKEECGGKACFQIKNHPLAGKTGSPEISITGTTGVELCAGLHWYLKYWCGVHVSWEKTGGTQMGSVPQPGALPRVNGAGIRVQRPVAWSYYQNAVTSSYSFVWWDWKRWEEEIDWMALQGINLPLAFTGQEAIWKKVFQSPKFNLSKPELDDFFGGPAFLAWSRMGNLHGWGGPLPQTWLDQQLDLQKRILAHMRQLGMTPVLPAFSGNVPSALQRIFPSAKITQLSNWNTVNGDKRWCCTSLLDPTDAHFVEIGKAFVQQQIEEYGGSSHIYNCDTFNENDPPTNDPTFISSLGAAVYEGMHAGDNDAVWLMQGWIFTSDSEFWQPPQMQALLHSVPLGRMVVLDLFAEVRPEWQKSDHFYGIPYIWCMLHNFAGNTEMYGALDAVASGPVEARTSANSTMVGVGMCMEGIEQNPVVYDLMAEMAFHSDIVKLDDWIKTYSIRRYGTDSRGTQKAWDILHKTVYNCSDGLQAHNTDIIVKFPDVDADSMNLTVVPGHLWYATGDAIRALHSLLQSSELLRNVPTYRYDVVDLTRQVLAKLANQMYYDVLTAYQAKDVDKMEQKRESLLQLLSDMDNLLSSNEGFLLGPWIESAKALATTTEELQLYEWNARTLVTMWFDNTADQPSQLRDYGNRYWNGLLADYYLPRASLYFHLLHKSILEDTTFPYETWRRKWIFLTNAWQGATNAYPLKAKGDAISIATLLSQKYTGYNSISYVSSS
eukprot:c20452_g2_i1 orf=151-2541(-)